MSATLWIVTRRHAFPIAVLTLLVVLFLPASARAQNTVRVLDSEQVGDGPGDVISLDGKSAPGWRRRCKAAGHRRCRYTLHMGFNKGEAVTHRVEPDGTLTLVGRTPVGPEPRAIALAHGGDLAIIANSIANELGVFEVGEDGLLREINRVPSGGLNPYDVAVGFDDLVFVVNRDSNQLDTFRVDRDGNITPLDSDPTGLTPHVVVVGARGHVAVMNQVGRDMDVFSVNRNGDVISRGRVVLGATPRTATWGRGRDLFVALDLPAPSEDAIRAFHVTRRGEIVQGEDTPAGAFLTDLEANEDGVFAVTVNTNGPGGADDRDEVRAYKWDGNELTLDAAVQTPGAPPSFKQIGIGGRRGRGRDLFTTEYQGGWLRSFLYGEDED